MITFGTFTFEKFIESGLLVFAVNFLRQISKTNTELTSQGKVLIERINWHHTAIQELGSRLTKLEELKRRTNARR